MCLIIDETSKQVDVWHDTTFEGLGIGLEKRFVGKCAESGVRVGSSLVIESGRIWCRSRVESKVIEPVVFLIRSIHY